VAVVPARTDAESIVKATNPKASCLAVIVFAHLKAATIEVISDAIATTYGIGDSLSTISCSEAGFSGSTGNNLSSFELKTI